MNIRKILCITAVAVCIFICAMVYVFKNGAATGEEPVTLTDTAGEYTEYAGETEGYTPEHSGEIFVYVCGCVNSPGVIRLKEGSRVYEAVEQAGGMTGQADINSINQAEYVSDGQKIYIPAVGEQTVYAQSEASGGKVNINTAGISELMTLPGIGQTRAQAIVDYRESNGFFRNITDIMNVSGIKESSFEKIKDYISV